MAHGMAAMGHKDDVVMHNKLAIKDQGIRSDKVRGPLARRPLVLISQPHQNSMAGDVGDRRLALETSLHSYFTELRNQPANPNGNGVVWSGVGVTQAHYQP
jgi:hypothetical protein